MHKILSLMLFASLALSISAQAAVVFNRGADWRIGWWFRSNPWARPAISRVEAGNMERRVRSDPPYPGGSALRAGRCRLRGGHIGGG